MVPPGTLADFAAINHPVEKAQFARDIFTIILKLFSCSRKKDSQIFFARSARDIFLTTLNRTQVKLLKCVSARSASEIFLTIFNLISCPIKAQFFSLSLPLAITFQSF